MPFKAGKSPQDAANNVSAKIKQVTDEKLEIALTKVAYAIGANADFYVPVDTNALMNSRTIKIVPQNGGFRATIGYYQDYAAALHGTASYSPLWKPKPPGTLGKKTGGYNADARPGWIFRGVEDTDVQGLFKRAMTI
ncbi:MAG: hypothetical protein V2J13_01055 [Cycloclasticus sp.]|jgi:hypothetical protein|nr:hypothetical protein [Cycloclasticus sp.]